MIGFRAIWNKNLYWSRDRSWNIEIYRDTPAWLVINLDLRFRGSDHAGPKLILGIAGYCIEMSWPRRQHWDYKNGHWQRNTRKKVPPKL